MWSGLFWQKWRRTLPVLLFLSQYYLRMLFLALRYRVRTLTRADVASQAYASWHRLCQALSTGRAGLQEWPAGEFPEALRAIRQGLASERLHRTLARARRKFEQFVFVQESPTLPTDVSLLHTNPTQRIPSATLRAARRSLQTFKTASQYATALTSALLASLLLIAFFAASGWLVHTLHTMQGLGISSVSRLTTSQLSVRAHQAPAVNASRALLRISQLDGDEYASQAEYSTWAYSACSTASLTEVMNAYGRHYRITDVLRVESRLGEITPQLGLVENAGIAITAAHFGFQTDWGNHWTLEQVISLANLGRPVIVGWPPQRYDGGHIVVVTGGDASSVSLADSSRWNRQVLSHAQFLQWWGGFAAVLLPA